jgi:hypothetical protein
MKHRSRFDRQWRLLRRCRSFLKTLNGYSDMVCREREVQRGEQAEIIPPAAA